MSGALHVSTTRSPLPKLFSNSDSDQSPSVLDARDRAKTPGWSTKEFHENDSPQDEESPAPNPQIQSMIPIDPSLFYAARPTPPLNFFPPVPLCCRGSNRKRSMSYLILYPEHIVSACEFAAIFQFLSQSISSLPHCSLTPLPPLQKASQGGDLLEFAPFRREFSPLPPTERSPNPF